MSSSIPALRSNRAPDSLARHGQRQRLSQPRGIFDLIRSVQAPVHHVRHCQTAPTASCRAATPLAPPITQGSDMIGAATIPPPRPRHGGQKFCGQRKGELAAFAVSGDSFLLRNQRGTRTLPAAILLVMSERAQLLYPSQKQSQVLLASWLEARLLVGITTSQMLTIFFSTCVDMTPPSSLGLTQRRPSPAVPAHLPAQAS